MASLLAFLALFTLAFKTYLEWRTHREELVRGLDAVREKFGDAAVRFGRELKAPTRSTGTPAGNDADLLEGGDAPSD